MLNYKTATNEEINYNGIVVKEISPTMKLNLRGKKREFFTNIGKNLNMLLPTEANTSTISCLLYTSPSPRDATLSRMPSSA